MPEEQFELRPEMYPGLAGPIPTTVGRYVFNWIAIYYAFGTRLPYLAESRDPLAYRKEMYERCVEYDDTDPDNEDAIRPYMIGRFVGVYTSLLRCVVGLPQQELLEALQRILTRIRYEMRCC